MKEERNRLTEGAIAGKLIRFAIPVFLGSVFQQLYNTADALIVGRMLGSQALAAVSATGVLVILLISLFSGISTGAGVLVSKYYGARDDEDVSKGIHTELAFDIVMGCLLTLIGIFLTPIFLRWMGTPEEILPMSVLYLRVYYSGSICLVLYNGCRSIMQALGDSRHPLYYLIFSSVLNVILDYVFIRFFHGGVGSAALATVIAQFISAVLCLVQLSRTGEYRVSLRKIRFTFPILKEMLSYGLPAGIQTTVTYFANVVAQSFINSFGTMAIAGFGAYGRIEGFGFLPITCFAVSITTFVGQNLGAKKYDRARAGAKIGIISCFCLSLLVGLFAFTFARQLIGAFVQDEEAIRFGVEKMRVSAFFWAVVSLSHTVAAVLRGSGRSVIPMISMFFFWFILRLAILYVFMPIWHDIRILYWLYPITWVVSAVFLLFYFWRADWVHGFEKKGKLS